MKKSVVCIHIIIDTHGLDLKLFHLL